MANQLNHCPACGKDYWDTQRWQHEECRLTDFTVYPACSPAHVFATNKVATNTSATNRVPVAMVSEKAPDRDAGKVVSGKSKNGRARESYNAYQREYMRKSRSAKKSV